MKKLYLLSQSVNNDYDTYDSAVVCAPNERDAQWIEVGDKYSWASPKDVKVREIGIANEDVEIGEIICSSFNAG